ncbi:AAA family ATPase [Pseudonocardia sp. RS11V-5]|uniref:bifunctional aminoglycoside phosphotransferase/ATP-binding protein n=1 Tax=Pseudonocardia terrae TaxID=2905831 RepID=UPI001E61335C|nr:AAA family ATPase [Pseudonocardia terrae]MCE3553154.1 AAA family ATPase [Pseudonocardia terrae]
MTAFSPWPGAAVRETHVGIVVLVDDRAYKVKKPVRTAFCDFSTPELRRVAIRRELELNRRLAPDVYLGAAELTGAGCAEPVLVMRRMPEARRLSALVIGGADPSAQLRQVARLLAAFHAGARRSATIAREGGRDALRERWQRNLEEMEPYRDAPLPGDQLDAVGRLALRFLDGRSPLFAHRTDRIVDGHGDLIADDVFCLDDGPRVLDCLDFDDRLRYVDGLDDAAFLAMDLEHLGAITAAERFLTDYAEFAGDPAPATLAHHYVAYRAGVRAKVACLRWDQNRDDRAAEDARAHLSLAAAHLRRGAPRLALVGGLPGTGKSTLAGALADRTGAVLLSSDRLRKERAGLDPRTSASADFGAGLYDASHTADVYAELLHRATGLLALGESVVLDASWTAAGPRDRAAVAGTTAAELLALCCAAPAAVAAERIRTRRRSASDATVAIAERMATVADPWPGAVIVRTDSPLDRSLAQAAQAWDDAAG